jgi:branched-subunit amino acid transport protein
MTTWIVMLAAGLGTYLLRVSMVVAHESVGTPKWLERRLHRVGRSMLAAVLISSVFLAAGRRTTPDVGEIVSGGCAFAVVRRTRNVGWALVVGFPVYWVTTALASM